MKTRTTRLYKEEIALTQIDWRLLADSVAFYEAAGFEYMELPYFVPTSINNITFDGDGYDVSSLHSLVGSAEQSFLNEALSIWRDSDLAPGKYVGVTPCFRREPEHTGLTQPHFMKVELFDCRPEADAWALMLTARQFMRAHCDRLTVETTSAGWDLMIGQIEVGSYGVRSHRGFRWAYGTGLALPRFSIGSRRP